LSQLLTYQVNFQISFLVAATKFSVGATFLK